MHFKSEVPLLRLVVFGCMVAISATPSFEKDFFPRFPSDLQAC